MKELRTVFILDPLKTGGGEDPKVENPPAK